MASMVDLWNSWKGTSNNSQSNTPKVTTPAFAYKDPYNPGGSNRNSSVQVVHVNTDPKGTITDPSGVVWKNNGYPDLWSTAENMYNTSVANSPPKYDSSTTQAYTQGRLNGTIPSTVSIDKWMETKGSTSYPNNNLDYGPANGSNVPSYYTSFPGSSNTTNTYDPDAASRQAQDKVDEYYKQQQDLANQQAAANRTAQLDRLRAAYDTQRADINSQIPELETTAQQALTQNENDYYNKYKPQMLAAMEQSGGYKGGQMVDSMQGLITALQNNQSNVNITKLQQEAKLRQALSNLNTQQASDETQVNSNIDASTYDKLMSALQNSQQQKITLEDMYNDNAYKKAALGIQQQAQDQNAAFEMAKLRGLVDPHPGLQMNKSVYDLVNNRYNGDWMAAINDVNSGKLSQEYLPYFEEGRYQKVTSNPTLQQQYGSFYQTQEAAQAQAQKLSEQVQLAAQYDPRIGNSGFKGEYEWVINNPKASMDEIQNKADLLISEYGENGYNILLAAAKLAAGLV